MLSLPPLPTDLSVLVMPLTGLPPSVAPTTIMAALIGSSLLLGLATAAEGAIRELARRVLTLGLGGLLALSLTNGLAALVLHLTGGA